MQVAKSHSDLQTLIDPTYYSRGTIGFVPTMGALHEGHASLVRNSANQNQLTVVSVFVNPTQFGPGEDFDKYPRKSQEDLEILEAVGANIVFMPSVSEMYPQKDPEILLQLRTLNKILCGASRPGHFDGVLQVVARLLMMVRPNRAYFGTKDFQQLTIIRTMVQELFFPVEIIGCPIVREADGLAMSSRNNYLSPSERKSAVYLYQTLSAIKDGAMAGTPVAELLGIARSLLAVFPDIDPEYCEIRSGINLQPVDFIKEADKPIALIAARCGNTRLIDNMFLF